MDFTRIKELYIPEGKVKMITFPDGSSYLFGPEPYKDQYLTIESLEDGNEIGWKKSDEDSLTRTIQYSTDKTNWSSATSDTTGVTLATLNTGDKLYLRSTNASYGNFTSNTNHFNSFTSTKKYNVYGNIMSLINASTFKTLTSFTTGRTLTGLFMNSKVVDASNLILPVIVLNQNVPYYRMFYGCTELVTPPALPATTLSTYCYQDMFYECSKLITPPALPATTCTQSCYTNMFYNCTSLTSVPALPATTLSTGCYQSMFYNCTSLTTIPTNLLPATTLTTNCYYNMFNLCSGITNVPNLPATILAISCYRSMFRGCSSLTTIPSDLLPATTLTNLCYYAMFESANKITTAPDLPATTLVTECYRKMFNGCSKLNYIKMLATDISATNCLDNWVSSVAASGTFVKDYSMTSLTTGISGIPSGWTVQDVNAPNYTTQYLTIESLEDGNVIGIVANDNRLRDLAFKYSTDGENWTTKYISTSNQTIATLNTGDKIYLKGNNNRYAVGSFEFTKFTSTKTFNLYGNIMSLITENNFDSATTLNNTNTNKYCFSWMFSSSKVVDASNLVLPATSLADYCYFCMFNGCTSLTTAPELPATTLASNCYNGIFQNCTSLTTAPELPATSPANYCYGNMFYGCTNLNYIKMMLTNIDNNALVNWVYNVQTVGGTFIKNPDMDWLPTGVHGVPENWTLQDAA